MKTEQPSFGMLHPTGAHVFKHQNLADNPHNWNMKGYSSGLKTKFHIGTRVYQKDLIWNGTSITKVCRPSKNYLVMRKNYATPGNFSNPKKKNFAE